MVLIWLLTSPPHKMYSCYGTQQAQDHKNYFAELKNLHSYTLDYVCDECSEHKTAQNNSTCTGDLTIFCGMATNTASFHSMTMHNALLTYRLPS